MTTGQRSPLTPLLTALRWGLYTHFAQYAPFGTSPLGEGAQDRAFIDSNATPPGSRVEVENPGSEVVDHRD